MGKGKGKYFCNVELCKPLFSEDVNEGPPIDLLRWYGYADVSTSDSFPFTTDEETSDDETIGKNLASHEDTKYIPYEKSVKQKAIKKSDRFVTEVVLGLANVNTWDDIVKITGKRLWKYADKGIKGGVTIYKRAMVNGKAKMVEVVGDVIEDDFIND